MSPIDRALLALAGLAGLLGIAGGAAAAHSGGLESLRTASEFLLFHAPLVVGLVALVSGGGRQAAVGRAAAGTVLVGLALFCGDLALRTLAGTPLFPFAAPAGGALLMLGWALVAGAAFLRRGA